MKQDSSASRLRSPKASADTPWEEPGASGEHLDVEDFPTFVLGHLATALQREVTNGYLAAFDLPAPQWRILAALAAYTPIPFSELVRLSMSDKALVSRTVQLLLARGLAQTEADPAHGKRVICRISPKGRALFQRVLPRARRAQADLLALLDPAERSQLYRTLMKLRAALGDPEPR